MIAVCLMVVCFNTIVGIDGSNEDSNKYEKEFHYVFLSGDIDCSYNNKVIIWSEIRKFIYNFC